MCEITALGDFQGLWKGWDSFIVPPFPSGRHFHRSSFRAKSGEMQTEFNHLGIQIVGFLTALFALGILYDIGNDLFRN